MKIKRVIDAKLDPYRKGIATTIDIAPIGLVKTFGVPGISDNYKTSGEYTFEITYNNKKSYVELYDWKQTSLWYPGLPTPKRFWSHKEPIEFVLTADNEKLAEKVKKALISMMPKKTKKLKKKKVEYPDSTIIRKLIDVEWVKKHFSNFDMYKDYELLRGFLPQMRIHIFKIMEKNKINVTSDLIRTLFTMVPEENIIYDIPDLDKLNYELSETGRGDGYDVLKIYKNYVVTYKSPKYPNRIFVFNTKKEVRDFLKKRLKN